MFNPYLKNRRNFEKMLVYSNKYKCCYMYIIENYRILLNNNKNHDINLMITEL